MARVISVNGVGNKEVIRLTNLIQGTSFKTYADLEEKMFSEKARIHKQWVDSGCTDFTVYDDPEYVYEGIHCFEKTRACCGGMVHWFKGNTQSYLGKIMGEKYSGPDYRTLETLDVYNGIGLTTMHVARNGFNVESFNDCVPQINFMQTACKEGIGREIVNHTSMPEKQYDVVMSFEVLEHYTNPLEHVEQLIKMTKPGGYLCESSGFNGSSINIGHFETYTIDGRVVPFREARRLTTKMIEKHYTKVFAGFNRMPQIWKLK